VIPVADLPAAPPPKAPAIVAPAPFEVSFGRVAGTVSPATDLVVVSVGGKTVVSRKPNGRRFSFTLSLPRKDVRVRVTAVSTDGRRASSTVGPVFGLPRSGAPSSFRDHEDARLAAAVRRLTRGFPGTAAAYVQDLRTGAGAAWNARARFPAASTLKLAIAIAVLARTNGPPARGTASASLLRKMLVDSDDRAANSLLVSLGGSTSAGGGIVDSLMRGVGVNDSIMYGGYLVEPIAATRPIPLRVDEQPSWGRGKYTTAYDLARLVTLVHQAAGGRGALVRGHGFSPREARWLLYLLAHSADRGKLDRFIAGGGVAVPHKAGWISAARHDAGIVYWPGGAIVAAVMTYGAGVGTASDVLAGRIAQAGLRRIRELSRQRPYHADDDASA
jgi:beta-lactamase class A